MDGAGGDQLGAAWPMTESVLELFPEAGRPRALEGLYRDAPLTRKSSGPFVYTNFITSLDGRIALDDTDGQHRVPSAIANPRDWRLFQELAAHADVIVTSGRYLRDLNLGQAQDHLPVSEADAFEDLRRWRLERGLSAQPDIAILSYGLSFVLPDSAAPPGAQDPYLCRRAAQRRRRSASRGGRRAGARGAAGPRRSRGLPDSPPGGVGIPKHLLRDRPQGHEHAGQ